MLAGMGKSSLDLERSRNVLALVSSPPCFLQRTICAPLQHCLLFSLFPPMFCFIWTQTQRGNVYFSCWKEVRDAHLLTGLIQMHLNVRKEPNLPN